MTPDGSKITSQTGKYSYKDPFTGKSYTIPTFTSKTSLSPMQTKIKGQQDKASLQLGGLANSQISRLNSVLGKPMTLNGMPAGGNANAIRTGDYDNYGDGPNLKTSYVDDFSKDRQRVEDALMQRMQGQLDKDRTGLETRLANQGIRLGSTAYDRGTDELNRQSTDARLGAILSAGEEQSRMAAMSRDQAVFGNSAQQQMADNTYRQTAGNNDLVNQRTNQDLIKFNAQNTQRKGALDERFAMRNQPLNEISALLAGSQLNAPQFNQAQMGAIPTTDVAGLMNSNYSQQFQNFQNQQQQKGNILGGLFGAGGSILGSVLSDRRAKTNIRKIGKTDDGQKLYSYRYKTGGPTHIGLMAQEVEKKRPEAVVTLPSGLKAVNYNVALGGILGMKEAA